MLMTGRVHEKDVACDMGHGTWDMGHVRVYITCTCVHDLCVCTWPVRVSITCACVHNMYVCP